MVDFMLSRCRLESDAFVGDGMACSMQGFRGASMGDDEVAYVAELLRCLYGQ